MVWLYTLVAPVSFLVIAYKFCRQTLYERIGEHLRKIQYEHVNWISNCLEWTREGWDGEARFAAEQVEKLRSEIDFYRRMLERLQKRA